MSDPNKCCTIDQLIEAIDEHAGDLNKTYRAWAIEHDVVNGGRGVYAKRNISVHETIFADRPLLIGPITGIEEPLICAICYRNVNNDNLCPNECGMPICDGCPKLGNHLRECELIRSWSPKTGPDRVMRAVNGLAAIRALLLADKQKNLLRMLQSNHSIENEMVTALISEYDAFPVDDADTVAFLKLAISVRNTNAFRILLTADSSNKISVSGLFPLTGLMNHDCVPNVRLSVNDQMIAEVIAVRDIKAGEPLCIT